MISKTYCKTNGFIFFCFSVFSLESAAEQFKTGLHDYLLPDRLKLENVNEFKKPRVTVLTKDPVINADPLSIKFLVSQVRYGLQKCI